MTEDEWLSGQNPTQMWEFIRDKGGDRKLRLFAVACCRELAPDINDPAGREAVDVAEWFVDGMATAEELREAVEGAAHLVDLAQENRSPAEKAAAWVACESASHAAEYALGHCVRVDFDVPWRIMLWWRQKRRMRTFSLRVLRDIFGNPFRSVTLDPSWLTSTVVALARGIYEERAFDRLPILADALMDAGCDRPDLLGHCRDPQLTHVRGCWVIDLLGKS